LISKPNQKAASQGQLFWCKYFYFSCHCKHPRMQLLALFKYIDLGEEANIGWNNKYYIFELQILLSFINSKSPPLCPAY
jgi:hypothetical protein